VVEEDEDLDLGIDDDDIDDETEEERAAREELEVELNEESQAFVDFLVDKLMLMAERFSGHTWYNYQRPFAMRFFESMIIEDGATLTALYSRQSGKSETVANCIATAMVMLPILAKVYPFWLDRFSEGVWVGAFAPVDEQADTLFSRIVGVLESENTAAVLADPDINGRIIGKGKMKGVVFAGVNKGSEVRKTTCHPRATIEGRTYHIILIDECQGADDRVVNKSIEPMGTATGATMVFTGTCTYNKNVFYNQIQVNKRELTKRGQKRQNHFEVDWKTVARENKRYGRTVKKIMIRVGEDSDEFKLSFRLIWLLDKGMFTTNDKLDKCGDKSMQLVPAWTKTPVVVGIDPARIQDKTIVTVLYVDWDHPDDLGYYHHRVLNWLDLEGLDWEVQYYKIVDFLSNYNVWKIGVDSGGVGDAVAQRLQLLMPATEVIPLGSAATEQSVRWKYLRELIDRTQVVWPAHSKVKRLKTWKRFRQEMEDLEISFKGPHMQAEAPHIRDAHDDYADSLSMACILSQDYEEASVEVYSNPFYSDHRGAMY
jgi:terminase large subunit-like protein